MSGSRVSPSSTSGDGSFVATLAGEIDLGRRAELGAIVDSYRGRCARDVVVDVGDVRFADSELLTLLARLHEVASCRGGHVTVRGASPAVRRLLTIVGLDFVIDVEDQGAAAPPAIRLVET